MFQESMIDQSNLAAHSVYLITEEGPLFTNVSQISLKL